MDKLIGIPINLIEKLITEAPWAAAFIAITMIAYYYLTRLAVKRIRGNKKKSHGNKEIKEKGDPEKLYDSTLSFALHAGEFIFLIGGLIYLCGLFGLIENPYKFFMSCIPK